MTHSAAFAAATFAVAVVLLVVLRAGSELDPPYPRAQAPAAVIRDDRARAFLAAHPWTSARVIALDRTAWRVTYTDGPRLLLEAAVGPSGRVDVIAFHLPGRRLPGSKVLWTPALLVLLTALFVVAVAASPVRSLRNLDALVVAGAFTASALLWDARLIAAHVYVGATALAYVAARCTQVALASRPPDTASPLHEHAVRRVDPLRLLAMVAGALLVAGLLLTLTSTGASDVAFAALAGATEMNHGELPYGNLSTDVVHGDTYPIFTYVLYMPAAAISPVRDAFDSLDGALWVNAAALAAAAAAAFRLGASKQAGLASATAWLAFPPVLLAATSGGNDVPTALFVLLALLAASRPAASAAATGLAAWTKVVPAVALPLMLVSARGRALRAASTVVAALCAAMVALVVALGGTDGVSAAWDAMRFQFERGSWASLWQQLGIRDVQPVFQAGTLAFAAYATAEVWRRRLDARRAAALAGAVVALLQISANYWTYMYLPWLLPFILVALFPQAPRRSPQP